MALTTGSGAAARTDDRAPGAADDLICRLVPDIRRQASRHAAHRDVEDVVQAVCEKLLRRRLRLLEHPNPLAYALRAVITTASDSRWSREVCTDDLVDLAGSSACATVVREAEWEAVRLLSLLSAGQARALVAVDLDGRTIDEAAAHLGVHRGTVSRLRARGLGRLRQTLAATAGG